MMRNLSRRFLFGLCSFRRHEAALRSRDVIALTERLTAMVALVCFASGCQTAGPISKPTQTDRLMAAYPDLKDGRFALLADFESPIHMELVQLRGVSQDARAVRSTTAGRSETGGACLSFTAGSAHDALRLSNDFAAQWYLRRDWRPFDLLLMSVQAPRAGLTLNLDVLAGAKDNRLAAGMKESLAPGWNTLRLDLAELGEQIPLDDIRELTLSISTANYPVKINLDDMMLTSSRTPLLGDPNNADGSLYALRKGRRWHLGAGGRFELVFSNGQIVGWYNTAVDPYHLRNLVQNTVLGPTPAVLSKDGQPIATQFGPDNGIRTRQRFLEVNSVRIMVQSIWQFTDARGKNLPGNPQYVWTYTIYPTGQLFTEVVATPPGPQSADTRIGITVSLASRNPDDWQDTVQSSGQVGSEARTFAFARSADTDTLLLFVPDAAKADQAVTPVIHTHFDRTRQVRSWVYSLEGTQHSSARYDSRLFLTSSKEHDDARVRRRALGILHPASSALELGTLVTAASQSATDPQGQFSGTIDIAPDRGQVRLVLDNTDDQYFTPCLRIFDRAHRKAWVYVDHLIFKPFVRESDGSLVFQLPELARRKSVVEVLFQQ